MPEFAELIVYSTLFQHSYYSKLLLNVPDRTVGLILGFDVNFSALMISEDTTQAKVSVTKQRSYIGPYLWRLRICHHFQLGLLVADSKR
jgi:hypothetical protein